MAERRPVFVLLDAVFTTVVRDGLDPLSVAVPPAPGLIDDAGLETMTSTKHREFQNTFHMEY